MHRSFPTQKVPRSHQRVGIVRGSAERAKTGARTMATDGKNFITSLIFVQVVHLFILN